MRKKYVPVQGVWEITLACNMRCRHCGSHAGVPRPDELTTAEALRVLGELAAAGCRRLVLSGGEPTVRRDWPRLVEEGTRLGIQMKMISNGWSFDAETARVARAAGLRAVGFSLDGLEKTHEYVRRIPGSFRRVLDAVEARYPMLRGMMTWSINWDSASECNGANGYAENFERIFGDISTTIVDRPSTGSILITPNPANDRIVIRGLDCSTSAVSILDVSGRVIRVVRFGRNDPTLVIADLTAAMHAIRSGSLTVEQAHNTYFFPKYAKRSS